MHMFYQSEKLVAFLIVCKLPIKLKCHHAYLQLCKSWVSLLYSLAICTTKLCCSILQFQPGSLHMQYQDIASRHTDVYLWPAEYGSTYVLDGLTSQTLTANRLPRESNSRN